MKTIIDSISYKGRTIVLSAKAHLTDCLGRKLVRDALACIDLEHEIENPDADSIIVFVAEWLNNQPNHAWELGKEVKVSCL